MIEMTNAMVMALWRLLPSEVQEGREPDDVESWVEVVLAAVERDNEVRPYCNDTLMPGVVCKRMKHQDDAGHYALAPGGSGVTW